MKGLLYSINFMVLILGVSSCNTPFEESRTDLYETPATRSADSSVTYYWSNGERIPLTINNEKAFVIVESDSIKSFSNRQSLIAVNKIDNYSYLRVKHSRTSPKRVNLTSFTITNSAKEIFDLSEALYVAPYYRASDGSDIGITNILSVKIVEQEDFLKLQRIADEYNIEIIGENEFDPSIYYLACTKESIGNSLEVANLIYESGAFAYSTPEFIIETRLAAIPNDTYFLSQWNLRNVIYPGKDISYVDTFDEFTFPHLDDIRVAVVDTGVYLDHEDLNCDTTSYNAHTGASPSVVYNAHATKVAGIIGAKANNNIGISGVAPNVKIMSISICDSESAAGLGISASTTLHCANAIRYAANKGAKVINNSWSQVTSVPIPDLNDAIEYAHSKECIVILAAGNDSGTISYPAAGAPDAALVVGAINKNGHKASFSNYGSALDVVAPGVSIRTTTCEEENGEYISDYYFAQGTSFAAPHVSGIAALIWAINPNLSASRVRDIIEQSTTKVGNNAYINEYTRLNGSWNQFYGYGLVNAYDAVSAAIGYSPSLQNPILSTELTEIGVSDLISMELDDADAWEDIYIAESPGNVTIYIDNYDPYATYEWTSTLPPYTSYDSSFNVQFPSGLSEPELHEVACTMIKNGSRTLTGLSIAVVPFNYSY